MKIVNRVIYGLIVALGLMLVATITDEYFRSREIIVIAKEILEDQSYTDLISSAYYHETPLYEQTITQNENEFLVLIYQAAHITQSNDELIVLEGFQILVIQKDGNFLPEYYDVVVYAAQDIEISYTGFNLYNQGIYALFDPDTQGSLILQNYFLKDDVFQTIEHIVFSKEGEILLNVDVSLTEDLLTIDEDLETYIAQNNKAPEEDIEGVNYKMPLIIDVQNKVIRNVVIYLTIVSIIYYLLFIRQPKTLGRSKATEGLKKDIDRLKTNKKGDL
jgi:hypothetical protein